MAAHTSIRRLRNDEINYTAEATAIQSAALAGVSKVVQLGPITFFSSTTGDAWMLDPTDHFAVCLARGYETRPIPIQETTDQLLIEWSADYLITEGATFLVPERTGAAYAILGYPTGVIERMAREMRGAGGPSGAEVLTAMDRLKTARNNPCPCGSGKKYKQCCLPGDEARVHAEMREI
jgi:hypothetical protein